jgi:hypothetical protein
MKRPNRKEYINKESKNKLIADLELYIIFLTACREYEASGKNRPNGYTLPNHHTGQRQREEPREIGGVTYRGQIYVEQQVTKANTHYANLREYVRTTKRLTKSELNIILDKMEAPLNNAMNTGTFID